MRNKKGFTLAEILIALGIISVMAALMATTFGHAKPDKVKMMYLKAYDSLCTAVANMANNDEIFQSIITNDVGGNTLTYNIQEAPLLDPQRPKDTASYPSSAQGSLKFARILETAFKGTDGHILSNNRYSFRSGPGNYTWLIEPLTSPLDITSTTTQNVSFCNHVTLTIDNADTFYFCVQPSGVVQVLDNKGQTFIDNRRNPRSVNDTPATAAQTTCAVANAIVVTPTVSSSSGTVNPNPPNPGIIKPTLGEDKEKNKKTEQQQSAH